jgi:hypothetical protein
MRPGAWAVQITATIIAGHLHALTLTLYSVYIYITRPLPETSECMEEAIIMY